MRILIDTSVAIAFRDGAGGIVDRVENIPSTILLSILSVVELEAGVAIDIVGRAKRRAALDVMYHAFEILPFGMAEATAYSEIILKTGFSRPAIIDRMIAAQAVVAGAAVATLNLRDFRRVPGLNVHDWSDSGA